MPLALVGVRVEQFTTPNADQRDQQFPRHLGTEESHGTIHEQDVGAALMKAVDPGLVAAVDRARAERCLAVGGVCAEVTQLADAHQAGQCC